ncbi:hypothetical protein QPK31_18740 [Massilia sp. YIM B02769]|uniref:hypothetical protein n=1 Tax=Massilia sp. YIM B02769 TaxID=3050129 RepID=UPI0025B65954|nr:hypothetical protein [Massilia sp. YIM B02769]MDN4060247.1 hypothetical protein [Massilia sp. YIM B02769]
MHIELNRTFRELLRDEKKGDDARALSPGNATLTLPDLLAEPRVVILSEAGSGKTEEIREAARSLRADGKAAFFLRLEHIVVDFDSAFEEGSLDEFQEWLSSSEQGWILLDSIDESRLRSPQDFETAMRKVSSRVSTAKQRMHLLLTGRAPAWRPKTDLELCGKLFPVADVKATVPLRQTGEMKGDRKRVTSVASPSSFKIVALEDLVSEQVKRFAEERGITDIQTFLDAIERADAWSFTARPQDLDELTGFWLDNGAIGSRLDLMENSVKRRLKEPDQTRAEALPLTSDRTLHGVQIIAAALMLTNQQIVQIPDGGQSAQGLRLDAVLTDWTDKEMSTLLQRPLFAQDIYGAVRFHHRSVKEYLASQWFLKLLSQEVSRRNVEGLFFREQYCIEVVVPSLRPLLPWLAMADNRILARVRRVAPEIVFEGGDPVQLPPDVRSNMLEQICDQLASGASTRLMADFAAIQRFAAPDITATVSRLIQKYRENDDNLFFLLRMVWQGRLDGALPEAICVACTVTADSASRIAAFRAVADLGTSEDMASIRTTFLAQEDALDRECMADLVSHVQHPDEQTLQWVLDCIPRLMEYNEYGSTGLSREVASFFERVPSRLVYRAVEMLHEFLTSPPVIERRYCELSQRYRWLSRAAGVAIRRLILERDDAAFEPKSLDVFHMLQVSGEYDARAFDIKKLGLVEAIQQWPELKLALFWHIVGQVREDRAENGERLAEDWPALVVASYLSFDSDDFESAVQAISDRSMGDDKLIALSLAFRLYVVTDRQRSRASQLRKAVGDDGALQVRLAELMNPPKKSEEHKKMDRDNARLRRRSAARRQREEKARLEAPGKLEAQAATLRDPGFENPSAVSRSQYYLYNRMRALEENKGSAKWTHCNWRALEHEFGPVTPRAFRDGMVRFWRDHVPQLVSEGAVLHITPAADLFGLAGLTIEAAETPMLFQSMPPAEAGLAFRYAMSELNGFPDWFPALSKTHIDLIKPMILKEVVFEFQNVQQNVSNQYIIYDLSRYGDWLWEKVAPDIVTLLGTYSTKSPERLLYLLNIVQASQLPGAAIAALAADKIASNGEAEHWPLWAAVWTGIDPERAIEAVEAQLSALADAKERTAYVMKYVTHLLGSHWMSSRVRDRFRSPAILRRLYILVHEHVRSHEDIARANMGAYSPGLRDNAQDARERLVGILKEIPGRDAYMALKAISESHPEVRKRPWFVLQARSKAEADSERPAWKAEQVSQFGKDFERTPANHRELFDLAVLRLLDLKHELENGDASIASVLIQADRETLVRNFIAAWCGKSSLNRYVIPQEEELPDAKRPDLRWHGFAFRGPVPTELKIADKWTGPELFERLEGQLAGDYLRDDASSRGIYLLVHRGVQKRWELPGGEMGNFEELIRGLQMHWLSVATAHPAVEEIKVIGIDLTKRAEISAHIKVARARKAAKQKSTTSKSAAGTGPGAKKAA